MSSMDSSLWVLAVAKNSQADQKMDALLQNLYVYKDDDEENLSCTMCCH